LDGVVGQVSELATHIANIEFLGTGPQVPVLIPISLQICIHTGHQHETANVKLATLEQQRALNVPLNDVRPHSASGKHILRDDLFDLVQILDDSNAAPSVGILSRYVLKLFLVKLGKPHELFVRHSFFYVEGKWNHAKRINVLRQTIRVEVVEQSLFIAQVEVAVQVIVDRHVLR
jgi:hypothetical protein